VSRGVSAFGGFHGETRAARSPVLLATIMKPRVEFRLEVALVRSEPFGWRSTVGQGSHQNEFANRAGRHPGRYFPAPDGRTDSTKITREIHTEILRADVQDSLPAFED